MKKIFTLIVAAMTFASSALALDHVPESGFTVKGQFGMNISTIRGFEATDADAKAKAGFNLGVIGEYMFPSCYGVFVNFGVGYTMKGAKQDAAIGMLDGTIQTVTVKHRPCYVEIPIHIGYRYNLSHNLGVYADFGPYIAIGTNGKSVYDFESDLFDTEKERFFRNDENGDLQRFDFGLGFRLGAEYANHHSLTLGMDWGMLDMYRHDYRKAFVTAYGYELNELKTFNCSISYGYRF